MDAWKYLVDMYVYEYVQTETLSNGRPFQLSSFPPTAPQRCSTPFHRSHSSEGVDHWTSAWKRLLPSSAYEICRKPAKFDELDLLDSAAIASMPLYAISPHAALYLCGSRMTNDEFCFWNIETCILWTIDFG